MLSCADCHVLDSGSGAHGGQNKYNLWGTNLPSACTRCHASGVYQGVSNAASRFAHNSDSGNIGSNAPYGMPTAGTYGGCMLCHASWDATSTVSRSNSYGGIHGSWSSTAKYYGGVATLTSYRFFPGAWRRGTAFASDGGWSSTGLSGACYFNASGTGFNACSTHAGGSTGTYTPNYSRPTKY